MGPNNFNIYGNSVSLLINRVKLKEGINYIIVKKIADLNDDGSD